MSKYVSKSTADVDAVEASAAVDVSDIENGTVIVCGTFVGTVAVQYSNDGVEFINAAAAVTAPAAVTLPVVCKAVRLNCTAYTSGTIKGRIGGRDPNRVS